MAKGTGSADCLTNAQTRSQAGLADGRMGITSEEDRPVFFLASWVVCNLIFGGVSVGAGIYVSQLALLGLCFIAVIRYCLALHYARLVGGVAVFAVALAWVFAANGQHNIRFIQEFLKLILLLVPGLLIAGLVKWKDVEAISRWAPGTLLLIMMAVYVLGLGDYYGNEGRFGVPWWGSPNNTGFLIAITIALLLYEIKSMGRGGLPLSRWSMRRWSKWMQLILLVTFLAATQSLGGLLTASVVGLRYLGVRVKLIMWGTLFSVFLFVLVVFYVHIIDIPVLLGSGRLIIWETVVSDLFKRGVFAWFIGCGPGGIDFTPWFTARVESGHSMYIEILYGYGLLGLCLFIFEICRTIHMLTIATMDESQRFLLEAIFCALVLSFFVDTYLMTAQFTWVGALLLGLRGLLSRPQAKPQ